MKTYTRHSEQNSYMPETALEAAKVGNITKQVEALANIQSHRLTLENDVRLLQEEIAHSIETVKDITTMVMEQADKDQHIKDCLKRGVKTYVEFGERVLTISKTHINDAYLVRLTDAPVYISELNPVKDVELESVKVA